MSARMRITRGKTGSRRSHHRLEEPRLSHDTETNSTHKRHHVDLATGMYRGKKIFEPKVVAAPEEVTEEKEEKKEKKESVVEKVEDAVEDVVEDVKEAAEEVKEDIEEAIEAITEEKKEK